MHTEILLADTNESVVAALAEYLEELGFSVHRAFDGSRALEVFERRKIRLALLATNLQGPSCEEIFNRFVSPGGSVEIIVMTTEDTSQLARNLLEKGAYDILYKPFDEKALEKTVRGALRKLEAIDGKDRLIRQLLSKLKRLEALVAEQEKRVAELESARRQAEDIASRTQGLQNEIQHLERLIDEKNQEIVQLQSSRSAGEVEASSDDGGEPDRQPGPGLCRRTAERLLLLSGIACLAAGLAGLALLPRSNTPVTERTELVLHTLLFSSFFIGSAVLSRLSSLSGSLLPKAEQGDRMSRSERLLAFLVRLGAISMCGLGTMAMYLLFATSSLTGHDSSSGIISTVMGYLHSGTFKEPVVLALAAAIFISFCCLGIESAFMGRYLVRAMKLHAQKSSARKRLETL